jgi:nucleoside-diphosphate-sugar epimerase
VTGATGFVGRALCRALVADGVPVRALVRGAPGALPEGCEPVRGDLATPSALRELVRGASVVVHCAGAVRGIDRAAFDSVNVAGTGALLDAVLDRAPGCRFVHVSTLAAREPALSDYAGSKRAAEALVAQAGLSEPVLLRPTAVYGPGDVELLPLLRAHARGLGPAPAVPEARVTLIHVDDLVAAIRVAGAGPWPGAGPFELAGPPPEGLRWRELADRIAAVTGRPVRQLPVPPAVLTALARIVRGSARLLGRAPMLTPGKVRELTHPDWSCDPAPFSAATGWQPTVTLAAGLAALLAERR